MSLFSAPKRPWARVQKGTLKASFRIAWGEAPGIEARATALKARFKNGPISFESRLQRCNCDAPESWGFAILSDAFGVEDSTYRSFPAKVG